MTLFGCFGILTTWVRFPRLPLEYYDTYLLLRIGEKIRKLIKIDTNTSLVTRGYFARICVELNLTKPYISKFKLRRRIHYVKHEGLHVVCFKYGKFKHVLDVCSFGVSIIPVAATHSRKVTGEI